MKKSRVAIKIIESRKSQGLSQEVLAEISGLSLRTIQRIENSESNPNGHTLRSVANALNFDISEFNDKGGVESNNSLLIQLQLRSLSFIVFPILGFIWPYFFLVNNKDKISDFKTEVYHILNFQLNWVIFFVFLPTVSIIFDPIINSEIVTIKFLFVFVVIMYLFNFMVTIYNSIRINNNKAVSNFYPISFFK